MEKKSKIIDTAIFLVLLAAASAVTLTLFYRQALYADIVMPSAADGMEEMYKSDMKAYMLEMQGLDSGYSFPYPVFFKLAAFIHLFAGPQLSVALATMLLNSLGIILVKIALNHLILPECGKGSSFLKCDWLPGAFLSLLAVSLFFVSMLYPPAGIYLPGIRFRYVGVFSPNPFHNATYMAARPFAILAFLWYVKLLPVYEKGLQIGKNSEPGGARLQDYILFSVFLLVATMTKPSFTIVLVGTAGLIMLYRLIRSCFQNFVPTLQLGLCFVPTFIDLLYQYSGVFAAEGNAEGGIGFTFGEIWGYYCDSIPLGIGLAIGFPLLVLVLNFRALKRDVMYRFSWEIYLMSFVMAFFLYEKGFRKPDFNFSWGYMYGIFFCHLAALVLLLRVTVRPLKATARAGRTWIQRLLLAAQWLAYLWHVACGLGYFGSLMSGGTYY